jgi:hypothetical protein
MSREIQTTLRESRSNSRTSETSHTNTVDKWEVFRDDDTARRSSVPMCEKQLQTREKSHVPELKEVPNVDDNGTHYSASAGRHHRPLSVTDITTISHLTQTLCAIATTRTTLLHQLENLQTQENEVIALLAQATSSVFNPSPLSPLNVPSLQTLRAQAPKMPKKKLHTRTVSASEIATPKSVRQSTRGRVPLGDKTPVIEDKTLDIEAPHFPATRVYAAKVVSKRVPIHFGDYEEGFESLAEMARSTSAGERRGRSRSSSCGRGLGDNRGLSSCGRNKSRSTSRVPDTPAAKLMSYAVPDTVARKRRDF